MLYALEHYHRPRTLSEAGEQLASDSRARVLGGGTRILTSRDDSVRSLVDVTGLGLDGLELGGEEPFLGATARLQDLVDAPAVQGFYGGILSEAAYLSNPSRLKRNAATVAGEILEAGRLGVLSAVALALGARLVVHDEGERDLDEVHVNGLSGIVTAIRLEPEREGRTIGLETVSVVETSNPMALSVAWVEMDSGKVVSSRVVVGAIGPHPVRLRAVEEMLEGESPDIALIERAARAGLDDVQIGDRPGLSGDYLCHLVKVTVRGALSKAMGIVGT